ncbi:hypothetical protein AAHA92_15831 [Salvia divinorum]|uniref:Uncharacterized protein n=1 Tax=Salvia divinorum TaxID=28513 RepID=A0ABD1HHC5_SALDI
MGSGDIIIRFRSDSGTVPQAPEAVLCIGSRKEFAGMKKGATQTDFQAGLSAQLQESSTVQLQESSTFAIHP